MHRPPDLATIQHVLWRLITAPEGAAPGLATLGEREPETAATARALVHGDDRLSDLERIDVYAGMYFYRLLDALKEDYPAVLAVTGAEELHNLVTDYLLVHPPSHPSLRYAGAHLAAFLADHPLRRRWPFLADLARLEWAIVDSFDAADAVAVTTEDLGRIDPGQWAELRFVPSPALQLLRFEWNVHDIWKRAKNGQALDGAVPRPTWVRIWRQDFKVYHRAVDDDEGEALELVRRGSTFGETCEHLAARHGEEQAAGVAARLLRCWLGEEIFAGLEIPGGS